VVSSSSRSVLDSVGKMTDLIKEEINVKTVTTTDKLDKLVNRKAKPNFKTLGPRMGKLMKQIAPIIQSWGDTEIELLEKKGVLSISIEGREENIHPEDVEIYDLQKGNMAVARDGNLVVGLDTAITPQLEIEGTAREFVNRIQNLRKDSNLEVMDRIKIYYSAPPKVEKAVQEMTDYIKTETLAAEIRNTLPSGVETFDLIIDEDTFQVSISKIKD
jgi:isoleucyl-tRNA synthetase